MTNPTAMDVQQELEIAYMDTLTAAYDNEDYAAVARLEDAMKTGFGLSDPSSPEGLDAMNEMCDTLAECGGDPAELNAIHEELQALAPENGTRLNLKNPEPGNELVASMDDAEVLKQQAPKAPAVQGPLGV